MGLGTDIATPGDLTLLLYIYAKYQWQYYGVNNETSWDGYGVKMKYRYPITTLWGDGLSYIGFTHFDVGADLAEKPGGERSNNAIASGHGHVPCSLIARQVHYGGQRRDGR